MLVPLVAITTLAIRFSTTTIERDALARIGVMVQEKTHSLERLLQTAADRSREIALSSSAWSLLNTKEILPLHSFAMREIAEENRRLVAESSLVNQSIFFDTAHAYVIGDTKWNKGEHGLPISQWEAAPIGVGVQPPAQPNADFPIILRYESFLSGNVGTFVTIVDSQSLFEDRLRFEVAAGIEVVVEDSEGQTLYRTSQSNWPDDRELRTVEVDGGRYFHAIASMQSFDLRLRYFQRSELATQAAQVLRRTILAALGITLIATLVIALLGATALYRPLYRLVLEVGASLRTADSSRTDEYDALRETMRDLAAREHELASQISTIAPYLRDHAFDRSLLAEPFDVNTFKQMLEALGVTFPYRHFGVLGVDLLHGQFDAELIRKAHAVFRRYSDEFTYALSHTKGDRIMVIANTLLSHEALLDRMNQLIRLVIESPAWAAALSEPFESLVPLPRYLQQVHEHLEHRFFSQPGRLQPANPNLTAVSERVTREQAIEALAQALRNRNIEQVERLVENIFRSADRIADGDGESEYTQPVGERLVLMAGFGGISTALRDAHLPGMTDERLEKVDRRIADRCATAGTLQSAISAVTGILQGIVGEVVSAANSAHEQVASRMQRFIDQNYRRDLSLEEIAATIPLSPGYASQIFRSSHGVSPIEYLQSLRMADAERLLTESDTKVMVIAKRVGYQNVHSFMRAFKSSHGATPTEYRRAKSVRYE